KMGGLWRLIWITYVLMWIGNLALAGIWPFAGYFSKDTILEAAWASGTRVGLYAFTLGTVAAFLTAFYSWRLLFLPFPPYLPDLPRGAAGDPGRRALWAGSGMGVVSAAGGFGGGRGGRGFRRLRPFRGRSPQTVLAGVDLGAAKPWYPRGRTSRPRLGLFPAS